MLVSLRPNISGGGSGSSIFKGAPRILHEAVSLSNQISQVAVPAPQTLFFFLVYILWDVTIFCDTNLESTFLKWEISALKSLDFWLLLKNCKSDDLDPHPPGAVISEGG